MPIKDDVMRKIRDKEVKMESYPSICAKKIGLESLLAFFIVSGALALNIIFYFFKKTDFIYSLSFGQAGVSRFLLSFPYDYFVLFIIAILLANFIIQKFDLSYGIKMNSNMAVIFLLAITILLSLFFLVNGVEDVMKSWMKNKDISRGAVSGEIVGLSGDKIVISEDGTDGQELVLEGKNGIDDDKRRGCEKGKMLRAIGQEEVNEGHVFYVSDMYCY